MIGALLAFLLLGPASTGLLLDQPPVLTVTAPSNLSVARPGIRVIASCTDDAAGCQVRVRALGPGTPPTLAIATGSLDTVVSLAAFEDGFASLEVAAIDSAGQVTAVTPQIFVDSSTHYIQRAQGNGQILAFDAARLLVNRPQQNGFTLAIESRANGSETVVLDGAGSGSTGPTYGFLTPLGAMFTWTATTPSFTRVFEWRSGTLFDHGPGADPLRVKGSFAVWRAGTNSSSLEIEDITSGTISTVATGILDAFADVTASGEVVYSLKSAGVFRLFDYLGGVSTPLPHGGDPSTWDISPVTDGTSVVYARVSGAGFAEAQFVSLRGGIETVRGTLNTPFVQPGVHYDAAAGSIAYMTTVSPGLAQVFAGPAGGPVSQMSFFSSSAALAALDDGGGGRVAFVSDSHTYLASPTLAAVRVGSVLGSTVFFNGVCYRIIGNTLFEVSATPVASSISALPASLGASVLRAADGSVASVTPPQTVLVTAAGSDPVDWTPTSDAAWLRVAPGIRSGTGTFTVTIDPSAPGVPPSGAVTGHVTIAPSTAAPAIVLPVVLNVYTTAATAPPFGSFDTPLDGAAGLAGSIAVTGWALDDVQVARLTICRDAAAGETAPVDPNCAGAAKIYIGDAVFVEGARTDVQAIFPGYPLSARAGWGYLLLTNFLPNGGNGAFVLYAYARDVEGHTTAIGTKSIGVDNRNSVAPFGAIDTPGQGAIVSGVVPNFGWVLSPGPQRADPPGGGSVTVFVDGVPVGRPDLWTSRADLSALFPVSQYPGVDTALGVFGLDTTTLSDGVHTIAWSVTDTLHRTSGIGSRFFTVANGASVIGDQRSGKPEAVSGKLEAESWKPAAGSGRILMGRRGFDVNAPLQYYFPDRNGVVTIEAQELDRIELHLGSAADGVQLTARGPRPLPIGSHLDPSTGIFTWTPGAGFVGVYELRFDDQRVRVVLAPHR